ncbi:MAG: RHS repeat protein, partial [Bacteroidales bacterium]|nr:RHS repeat protein [Bacteroidales bacterium]
HDTYHVYDTYGNLRWVITPQGSGSLSAGTTYTTESTLAKQYCYIYSYDGMGNITQKRLPGREPEYYVYDKGGRMVLYQDGNLRSSNRWIHTTWDNLNREVEKNLISTPLSREELHNSYNNTGHSNQYYYESGGYNPNLPMPEDDYTFGNNIYSSRYYGYQYQPILSSVTHQQSIDVMDGVYLMAHAYLDIPSFMQLSLYDSGGIYIGADDMIRDEYLIYTDEVGLEYYYIPQGYMDIIETMMQEDPAASLELIYEFPGDNVPATSVTLTGGLYYENAPTANLPFRSNALYGSSDLDTLHNTGLLQYERYLLLQHDTCTVPSYKETAHYYNSRSQLIQSVTRYPHSDSLHRMSYSYTFTGAPQSTIEEYNGITKRTDYTYDERCRLISETTTINDSAPATITYSYDALGKLISKTYGNGVTETINYNIQGWQTATEVTNGNSNIYSQQLKYYNPTKGSTPLYTGNISEWSTTMGTQAMNTYGFEYDKLGRLRNTLHYSAAAITPTNSYTERGITYDRNGNIATLSRYSASAGTPQDSYTYTYEGNRLVSITGTNDNATIADATYTYDSNGNKTKDGLKNLQISYNFLNLPSVVTQDDTPVAEYSWFADGSKYRVLTQQNNGYIYTG